MCGCHADICFDLVLQALAEQLVAREEARREERAREVEEPDPSHVHPVQPITDVAKVKREKEALRIALEEQVALKAAQRAAEKDMEIKQDRVFLESVFQECVIVNNMALFLPYEAIVLYCA